MHLMCIAVLFWMQKRRYITMKKRTKSLSLLLSALLLLTAWHFPVHAAETEESQEEKLLAPYFVIQSEVAVVSTDYFPLKST